MASPNLSEIVITTLNNRSAVIADNVTNNNALLAYLKRKGNIKTLDGGDQIYKGFSYQENANFSFYDGYDTLAVAAQQVLSGAVFDWKQAAVSVLISGKERLQNSGKERVRNLLDERMGNAESTMANQISASIYSDGTGYGGKEITGLNAAVAATPTNIYGGVDRSQYTFWKNQTATDASYSSTTIYSDFMGLWLKCARGTDKPELIVCDNNVYSTYVQSLQAQQRFTDPKAAVAGFEAVKFMSADVVFDGGIGGNCPADTAFFLNLNYLFWQPHKDRNMVPIDPGGRRTPINQDASIAILGFMGNLTCNGAKFQGRFSKS